ncbi:hypothetical protein [Segetibacter sp.]|jgi:hypothetical protein|uniref:hypothetical protein n=1 Tax=Segetibacter sp. TaxID=2231182 RepID=UPI0026275117|nr:hypothetical protein [Segetibacter sp.]MCW3081508.1 hypothetical protein [Segetibacter sp.]
MKFVHIPNAGKINTNDAPSRKKPYYPINADLRSYLRKHGREVVLPVLYQDLARITFSLPIKDKNGKDTYWEEARYDMREWEFIRDGLIKIYAILKTEGNLNFAPHWDVARIEYCAFGNSNPFRIKIVNKHNGNYDHFYVKTADASRIYGLELEHMLSPNRISYFTYFATLVEEHIPGIPGDIFVQQYLENPITNKTRFAKEFVKFNERCFLRLLGDMRSYNFVVDITPDIEDFQYRIRAIDFDQQSYEGRKNLYLPQFFKENLAYVELVLQNLDKESINQYKTEEKTLMAFRVADSRYRLMDLFNIMCSDNISSTNKIDELKQQLKEYFSNPKFLKCHSMGDIVKLNLKQTLLRNLRQIQEAKSKIKTGE